MTRARAAATTAAVPVVDWRRLAREAEAMRLRSYAPYSKYTVGSALLARDGRGPLQLFTGANVENASYGLCICAERTAIAAAVLTGARELVAIAIATAGPEPGAPCGSCRQVMAEFATDLPVALVVDGAIRARTTLAKLLPLAFNGEYITAARARRSR
jgi:cytidine deaminase